MVALNADIYIPFCLLNSFCPVFLLCFMVVDTRNHIFERGEEGCSLSLSPYHLVQMQGE